MLSFVQRWLVAVCFPLVSFAYCEILLFCVIFELLLLHDEVALQHLCQLLVFSVQVEEV